MNYWESLLLGIALSMDAVAVSAALGVTHRLNFTFGKIILTAFLFGLFQALMPTIGWVSGNLCNGFVESFGKIIASALLFLIAGKMLYDCRKKEDNGKEEVKEKISDFSFFVLLSLAFATSIDALLVGVGFSCLQKSTILMDVTLIGITTFILAASGGFLGRI